MLEAENGHIIFMSPAAVPHMEGRSPTDDLNDLDVNNALWRFFMSVTLQAAVHLGRNYMENLRFAKNQLLKSAKQLFQVTEKLIKDQSEISGLTTMFTNNERGDRRLYNVTQRLKLRMP